MSHFVCSDGWSRIISPFFLSLSLLLSLSRSLFLFFKPLSLATTVCAREPLPVACLVGLLSRFGTQANVAQGIIPPFLPSPFLSVACFSISLLLLFTLSFLNLADRAFSSRCAQPSARLRSRSRLRPLCWPPSTPSARVGFVRWNFEVCKIIIQEERKECLE